MLLTLTTRVRIWLWRARPGLVVLGLAVVALAVARAAAPPPPATDVVVVLARPVAAGHELSAADLRAVHLPTGRAPAGTTGAAEDWQGRRTALALPAGLPLVPEVLAGSRFAVTPPEGTVVVAVPVDGVEALRPGDRVELVATGCTVQATGPEGATALVVELQDEHALVATQRVAARSLAALARDCSLTALVVE